MNVKGQVIVNVLGLYLDKIERAFSLDSQDLVKINHERAAACIKRGAYDSAIPLCQKALRSDEDDIQALYQLG